MRQSDAIAAAVAESERRPSFEFDLGDQIDLTGVKLDKISVTETSTAGLPAEVTLFTGIAASTAKVTLSDRDPEDPTLVGPLDLFHPASKHPDRVRRSAQITLPARLALGFDGAVVEQLPGGRVRSVAFSEANRTVDLDLADAAVTMRDPVDLPAAGLLVTATGKETGVPVNSSAVATHVFNATGRRVTPPPRAGCVMSVPGVGGVVPEIGWLSAHSWDASAYDEQYPTWRAGKFGVVIAQPPQFGYVDKSAYTCHPTPRVVMDYGQHLQVEAWAELPAAGTVRTVWAATMVLPGVLPASGGAIASRLAQPYNAGVVQNDDGSLVVQVVASQTAADGSTTTWISSGRIGGPVLTGWHHIAVSLPVSSNACVVQVDGAVATVSWTVRTINPDGSQNVSPTTGPRQMPVGVTNLGIDIATTRAGIALQGLLVHVGPVRTRTWQSNPAGWMQQGTVAQGNLDIGALPRMQQRPGWDILGDLAAAELGFVGFGDDGRPQFGPQDELSPDTPADRTISTDLTAERSGKLNVDGMRNTVTVDVQPKVLTSRTQTTNGGFSGNVPIGSVAPFSQQDNAAEDDRIRIRPYTDNVIEFELPRPAMPFYAEVTIYPGGFSGNYTPVQSFVALSQDLAGNVAATNDQCLKVDAWVEPVSSTVMRMHVLNKADVELFAVWSQDQGNVEISDDVTMTRGNPAAVIYGAMLSDDDAAPVTVKAVDQVSVLEHDSQPLELQTNPFWNRRTSVQKLVSRVLARTSKPRAVLDDITVPGDPRIRCDDVIDLTDPSGRWSTLKTQVLRVERTFTGDGLTDTYSLLLLDDDETG